VRVDDDSVHPDIVRGQRQIDAAVAMMAGADVEQRVAIPGDLWGELSWLEDDRLHDAIHLVSNGYAEGEEEDGYYVFSCLGMPAPFLRELVERLLGDGYETTTAPAPEWAPVSEQIVVGRRATS